MLKRISSRISYLEHDPRTDRPHLVLIAGDKYAFMVDAGSSEAHMRLFLQELEAALLPRPSFIGVTHAHWDHSFGMCAAPCPTVACRLTGQILAGFKGQRWDDEALNERLAKREETLFAVEMIRAEYPDRSALKIVDADILFEKTLCFDLGGVHCEMIHVGGPHTPDGVIIYVPEERYLFLGDSNGPDMDHLDWVYDPLCPEKLPEVLATLPYDRALLAPYMTALEKLEFDTCLQSHAPPQSKAQLFAYLEQRL